MLNIISEGENHVITEQQLGEKWSGVAAVQLDIPPIVPDDWAAFWQIWNAEKARAQRIGADRNNTGPGGWVGLDLISALGKNSFQQPVVPELADACPRMMATILEHFPFTSLRLVRLWQSIVPIRPHREGSPNRFQYPSEFRTMLHDTNVRPTFYMTPVLDHAHADSEPAKAAAKLTGVRHYVDAKPGESFIFNGETAYHGAEYDPGHHKILVIVKGDLDLDRYDDLMTRSVLKHGAGAIRMSMPT